ncbi:hypothetical protein G9A89_020500 [Geosiphon pyriformis]|nr:hypothetical protein G9A89_020500 [Geosiphon pyriformis]
MSASPTTRKSPRMNKDTVFDLEPLQELKRKKNLRKNKKSREILEFMIFSRESLKRDTLTSLGSKDPTEEIEDDKILDVANCDTEDCKDIFGDGDLSDPPNDFEDENSEKRNSENENLGNVINNHKPVDTAIQGDLQDNPKRQGLLSNPSLPVKDTHFSDSEDDLNRRYEDSDLASENAKSDESDYEEEKIEKTLLKKIEKSKDDNLFAKDKASNVLNKAIKGQGSSQISQVPLMATSPDGSSKEISHEKSNVHNTRKPIGVHQDLLQDRGLRIRIGLSKTAKVRPLHPHLSKR